MKRTIMSVIKGAKAVKQVRVTINRTMLIGTVGTASFKWNVEKFEIPMVTINNQPNNDDTVRRSIGNFVTKALEDNKLNIKMIIADKDNVEVKPKANNNIPVPSQEKEVAATVVKDYYVVKFNEEVKLFDSSTKLLNYINGGKTVQVWELDDLQEAKKFAASISNNTPEPEPTKRVDDIKSSAPFDVQAFKEQIKKEILQELKQPTLSIQIEEDKEFAPPVENDSNIEKTAPIYTENSLKKLPYQELQKLGSVLGLGEKNIAKKEELIANILKVVNHEDDDIPTPDFEDDKTVIDSKKPEDILGDLNEMLVSDDMGF